MFYLFLNAKSWFDSTWGRGYVSIAQWIANRKRFVEFIGIIA